MITSRHRIVSRSFLAVTLLTTIVCTQAQGPVAEPETMKAIRVHEFGGPEVLKYEEAPIPKPGKGEMLVRVYAAGVNPVDAAVRKGAFARPELPFTPGYDVAGRVVEAGEGASMPPGLRVFAFLPLSRPGAYAEYAIVRDGEAAVLPNNISFTDGAGVPLVALTAWQALIERAEVKQGQTVLIHGGAGGVGTMAIQLAKSRGARVIATASETNHEFLRKLGADEVIDYTNERFEERVKDVDVVLDTVGGDTQERSWQVLKRGGMLVSIVQEPDQDKAREHGVIATRFLVKPHSMQLTKIAGLLEAGTIKPVTTHTFPLEEAAKAHEQIETRHTRGKIVLNVRVPLDTPEPDGVPKLIGVAISPDGSPAARLPVILKQVPEQPPAEKWVTVARTVTNDEGEFSLRGLREGQVRLDIGDPLRTHWIITTLHYNGRNPVLNVGSVRLQLKRRE